jgi:cell division protein ZapA (FtsZ GTPase activity inhibitor)
MLFLFHRAEWVILMQLTGIEKASRKATVPIRIMGESFLITSEQTEELVLSLAKELDERLNGARKLMPTASVHRIAISLALELLVEIGAEKRKSEMILEALERS